MDLSQQVVVIVGPTASGKTAIAIELAKKYHGEVICADSRTIYKGLDIGTAKPSIKEMDGVVHHGLDLVLPSERYSALQFKKYADQKIREIQARGGLPIIVGGTGLYVDALLYDYSFGSIPDERLRKRLESMSIQELHEYCYKNNIKLPENQKNKRYVIRAIENSTQDITKKLSPKQTYIVVGISTEKDVLVGRIAKRFDEMLQKGVIQEARHAIKTYGYDAPGLSGNIYRIIAGCDDDNIDLDYIKTKMITLDWQLAKRQRTWFARNNFIHWLNQSEVVHYIDAQLAKHSKI